MKCMKYNSLFLYDLGSVDFLLREYLVSVSPVFVNRKGDHLTI